MKVECVVKEIKKGFVTLEVPDNEFDTLMLSVDKKILLEVGIPYSLSADRRYDINEHHAEEGRNGDI